MITSSALALLALALLALASLALVSPALVSPALVSPALVSPVLALLELAKLGSVGSAMLKFVTPTASEVARELSLNCRRSACRFRASPRLFK